MVVNFFFVSNVFFSFLFTGEYHPIDVAGRVF